MSCLTTGEKVSSKSIPGRCEKPFATNLALYRGGESWVPCLNVKTQRVLMGVRLIGSGVRYQVLLDMSESYSSWMAIFHKCASAHSIASE